MYKMPTDIMNVYKGSLGSSMILKDPRESALNKKFEDQ